MRMSRLLVRTLREAPADAEVASHQLLVRGGYIRRLASGVYSFLPLGLRVLHNVEQIIREELDAAGCQEVLLPALHPLELWEECGRAALFGSDALPAMTVEARGGTFVLGPTHEEVVTVTVGAEVDSYRQLPLTVYQIQVKFRDEARPRFGLLRTRELIMADAYSFDVDKEAMQASYRTVYDAYLRIFGRLDLDVVPGGGGVRRHRRRRQPRVHGALGGGRGPLRAVPGLRVRGQRGGGHPRAASREPAAPTTPPAPALVEHHTPGRPGIERGGGLLRRPGVTAADLLKSLAVVDDTGRPTLAAGARGPRGPPAERLAPVRGRGLRRPPRLVKGYIGPMGQQGPGSVVGRRRGRARRALDHRGQPARPPRQRRAGRPGLLGGRVGLVRRGGDR